MLQKNFLREIALQFLFGCSVHGMTGASIRTQTFLHERELRFACLRASTP
jgi:hypothetical protein